MAVRQVDEFDGVLDQLEVVETEFRIGRLDSSFSQADDAEAVVEEYFKRLDYETFNLRGLERGKRSWLQTWFEFFEDFNFSKAGVPDLFVCRVFFQPTYASSKNRNTISEEAKVQDYRFVEVKSDGDDLRQSQLKWIGANPHLPVEVIIVTD